MEALIYKGIVAFLTTHSIASVVQEAWDVPWFCLHEGTGWQKNDRATKKAFKAYATKFTLQGDSCSLGVTLCCLGFLCSCSWLGRVLMRKNKIVLRAEDMEVCWQKWHISEEHGGHPGTRSFELRVQQAYWFESVGGTSNLRKWSKAKKLQCKVCFDKAPKVCKMPSSFAISVLRVLLRSSRGFRLIQLYQIALMSVLSLTTHHSVLWTWTLGARNWALFLFHFVSTN